MLGIKTCHSFKLNVRLPANNMLRACVCVRVCVCARARNSCGETVPSAKRNTVAQCKT